MEIYKPEDAFVMNLITFKFFGVWPLDVKNRTLRFIYKIYGYGIQLIYMMSILPTQLINLYLMKDDLQKLVNSSFFTMTCVGYILKLVIFMIRRKEIESLFERLHQPIFSPKRKEDLTVLKDYIFSGKMSTLIYASMSAISVGTWVLYPFVVGNKEKVLIFAAWYPYNVTVDPAYGCTYVFQTALLMTTASMNSQIDMLTANLYLLMVAQLELLKYDFRELANIATENNNNGNKKYDFYKIQKTSVSGSDSNYQEGTVNLTSSCGNKKHNSYDENLQIAMVTDWNICEEKILDKILNDRAVKCTLRYQAIIKFINDVTDLFQIGVVAQVCISSIVICATSYEMTSISPTSVQFYVVLQYQVCMLFEIFIYTWRGNDITVKTTELKDAVYECGWMSVPNPKFRKTLCIIMSPLQIPLKINVGKFFVLSVDTFFGIIKLAYSLYVVLKQMNDSKEDN